MPYNELRFIKKVVYIFDTMEGGGVHSLYHIKRLLTPPHCLKNVQKLVFNYK